MAKLQVENLMVRWLQIWIIRKKDMFTKYYVVSVQSVVLDDTKESKSFRVYVALTI
jgi:hypothetical protein